MKNERKATGFRAAAALHSAVSSIVSLSPCASRRSSRAGVICGSRSDGAHKRFGRHPSMLTLLRRTLVKRREKTSPIDEKTAVLVSDITRASG